MRGTGDVPDPNMSTTQFTSVNGGMMADSDVESEEIEGFDSQQDAVKMASRLRSKLRKQTQTMEIIRGRLQGWVSGADASMTIPEEASEIPHPEYGGRQWVIEHEEQVPFGILTEMVRLVEYKRKVNQTRRQLRTLPVRFDRSPTVSNQ